MAGLGDLGAKGPDPFAKKLFILLLIAAALWAASAFIFIVLR